MIIFKVVLIAITLFILVLNMFTGGSIKGKVEVTTLFVLYLVYLLLN